MPSVFDRLYSTETASSAGKRVGHPAPSPPPPRKLHSKSHAAATPAVHTKVGCGDAGGGPSTSTQSSPASKSSDGSTIEGVSSIAAVAAAVPQVSFVNDRQDETASAVVAATPSNVRLLCSNKYHPDSGLDDLSPYSLRLVSDLYRFENGDNSNHGKQQQRELARSIIEALWNRDFSNGKHWDIDSASVSAVCDCPIDDKGEHVVGVWNVSKSATWDWKDIYSVAKSEGTIRFLRIRNDNNMEDDNASCEIRIEKYSYYVAG
jgi:hypothetical protein